MSPKFIVDVNVGGLAKRLRMLGFDTAFAKDADDNELIRISIKDERVLLTKDTGIMKRRVVTTGVIKAILIESDSVREQLKQVVESLNLRSDFKPFTICMECNELLAEKEKNKVCNLIPPYVFKTQDRFMQCPKCERIYWQGTHWQKMSDEIDGLRA